MRDLYDLVVVGAGPSGLSAAIAAKSKGLSVCVIDQGGVADAIRRFPNGMTFFSTPSMLEIGGVPFVCASVRPTRAEVLCYYRLVAAHYQLELYLHHRVQQMQRAETGVFELNSARGGIWKARSVVLALGYFDQPNSLGVPGENLPHVFSYYQEPYAFSETNVIVVGGSNSAVEAALDLFRNGAKVTLVHRREALSGSLKYWIRPDIENRLAKKEIASRFQTEVVEIRPDSVLVRPVAGGETSCLPADFVFSLIGYQPEPKLLQVIGAEFDSDSLVPSFNHETFETTIPGLYVAGSYVSGKNIKDIFIENSREHGPAIVSSLAASLS